MFAWLIISYCAKGHMNSLYKIHAPFHGNTVNTEFKQITSEHTFTVNQ